MPVHPVVPQGHVTATLKAIADLIDAGAPMPLSIDTSLLLADAIVIRLSPDAFDDWLEAIDVDDDRAYTQKGLGDHVHLIAEANGRIPTYGLRVRLFTAQTLPKVAV